jgi:hypothetical protein
MVEHLIKTVKHGFTVMTITNIHDWDSLSPHIPFGYQCGIQASTKYFPFMVLVGRMLKLTIDNSLSALCDVFDEKASLEVMADQMILKM